jgi:hypothetical protein
MTRRSLWLTMMLLMLVIRSAAAASDAPLQTLRPGHPRLFALDSDVERLRALVASDPKAREWHAYLRNRASELLSQPPLAFHHEGSNMLEVSREALRRIVTLGLIYRLDNDRAYAGRAIAELTAVCSFPDWNPIHFLDTAEMTNAAAIGYDWLYALLTPQQRALVEEAIVDKGLMPGLELYDMQGGWVRYTHNWNQVCNSSLSIGALAIADEEPGLAASIINYALKSIPTSLAGFEPDGAWAEGPGYWRYATEYTVYLIAALESALGTDLGLSDSPGLDRTGDSRVYCAGPTYVDFNFADGSEGVRRAGHMFWLARRYRKPLYAWYERQIPMGPDPWALLWYSPEGAGPRDLPLDKWFRGVNVAFFRSAWDDPNAVFVGFKAGENAVNHGHLDLGTFVLDAAGQRWVSDLGADDYDLPGYFDAKPEGKRWTYYRTRTEGHNTLTINNENQALPCQAPIIAFQSTPERAFAVADLSTAYPTATRVRRGVALLGRRDVLVQDEIETTKPVDLTWAMHTKSAVSLNGAQAVLQRGGKTLTVRILSPGDAQFAIASADPGPPQARNEGVTKIAIRLPGATGAVRIAVLLSTDANVAAPALSPLDDWVKSAPAAKQ